MLKGIIRLDIKVLSNYINMTYAEYDAYIQSIDDMEQRVINDNVYPKVRSNRCKAFCYVISELTKECIRYFKNIN